MEYPWNALLVRFMPFGTLKNNDLGDWLEPQQDFRGITVAHTGNPDYDLLIAVHEIIEQHLCVRDGVPEADVAAWDAEHNNGDVSGGDLPDAPYHHQHKAAEGVEKAAAIALGVDWQAYCDALEAL